MTAEDGVYSQLARCHRVEEIMGKYEVTDEQASAVLAAMELGKRIVQAGTLDREHITSSGDAARFLMGRMRNDSHEKFAVVLLNTKNRVIRVQQIAEGSLTSAVVHPREVYAPAIVNHAACIIVAHNHPSGDPYPSTEDRNLTTALEKAGDLIGMGVTTPTQFWSKFLKTNGFPHMRFHDLRHLSATILIAAGIPIKSVSARLGHTQISTTLDIYADALESVDRAAADKMDSFLLPEKPEE